MDIIMTHCDIRSSEEKKKKIERFIAGHDFNLEIEGWETLRRK